MVKLILKMFYIKHYFEKSKNFLNICNLYKQIKIIIVTSKEITLPLLHAYIMTDKLIMKYMSKLLF